MMQLYNVSLEQNQHVKVRNGDGFLVVLETGNFLRLSWYNETKPITERKDGSLIVSH